MSTQSFGFPPAPVPSDIVCPIGGAQLRTIDAVSAFLTHCFEDGKNAPWQGDHHGEHANILQVYTSPARYCAMPQQTQARCQNQVPVKSTWPELGKVSLYARPELCYYYEDC